MRRHWSLFGVHICTLISVHATVDCVCEHQLESNSPTLTHNITPTGAPALKGASWFIYSAQVNTNYTDQIYFCGGKSRSAVLFFTLDVKNIKKREENCF